MSTAAQRKAIGGRLIRWDDARAADAYACGLWVRTTLADALREAARTDPDRVLLVDGDVEVTSAVLLHAAESLAAAMRARMPAGSVVSFMLPNWHEAAVVYLAATVARMVVNPVLQSLRDHELRFILEDADVRMIFVPGVFRGHDYGAMLTRVAVQLPDPPEVVVVRGAAGSHTAYGELLDADAAIDPVGDIDPDTVHMIMYTSGTTGRPKGVLHSHNSLHALISQIRSNWLVTPGDTFLVASPIAHIGGSIYAFECPLLTGATAVLMERWDADDAIAVMTVRHCTHMAGATPFLEQLLSAATRAQTRLPDLKVFICGGASVPPSLIRSATAFFDKATVTRVYGSTEVPVTTVGSPGEPGPAAETDGRAGIADIRLDADGQICARGAQMLVGYLHAEDEDGSFDAEGFFLTGDLGRWDDEHLVVTGRAKDLIIRNGENISPKEVEDILITHPAIAEVAVVGLPDSRTGERACAVVVPDGDANPTVDDLDVFLVSHGMARFKVPERVEIWEALPRNDAGKVLKHRIRTALVEGAK